MSKRWKKQKSGQQKAKKRPVRLNMGGGAASSSGTLSGFRAGLKFVTGQGGGKKAQNKSAFEKVFDIALWLAVIAALAFFASKQCR